MTPQLVSAIMPVYNAERFLEEALESLLAQDYRPFEVIVCDDGSTDGSSEILRRHGSITMLTQENRGAAAARNAAANAAKGELLAFFDADDRWPANRLTLQASFLQEHPHIGCVLGRQEWMNPPPWLTRDVVHGDLDGIPLLSAMIRRDVFERVGGFDTSFTHSEDMDLLFRLREQNIRIEVLREIVLFRRFHGDNLTAAPPATSPLLRSLRQKLERERLTEEQPQA
jgi:glycosyltransferase involved in cell wall biosynthesis